MGQLRQLFTEVSSIQWDAFLVDVTEDQYLLWTRTVVAVSASNLYVFGVSVVRVALMKLTSAHVRASV